MSARVSRGSFFGPLVFLKYFNDLADNVASKPLLLADDSSFFCSQGQSLLRNTILLRENIWFGISVKDEF